MSTISSLSVGSKQTDQALESTEAKGLHGNRLTKVENAKLRKVCPECSHVFQGNGWDGIDSHWRSKHEHIMPYSDAWDSIKNGTYKPTS